MDMLQKQTTIEWKSKKDYVFHVHSKRPRRWWCWFHKHMPIADECALASEIIYPKHAWGTHPMTGWLLWYVKNCNRIGIRAVYKKKRASEPA